MIVRRRPLLRAAALGGTAYAVGKSKGRQAEQQAEAFYEQNERISALEQQQPAAPYQPPAAPYQPPPPPVAAASPMIDQLNQLAALHQQGALSDAEFAAAKASLLGT